MSVRHYTGPHRDVRAQSGRWLVVPRALAGVTILGQVVWVLAPERALLTVITVVTFFLACATHALITRGWAWMLGYLVLTLVIGLAAESVGTRTGFPFGSYAYSDLLGPRLLDVPVVIPLAWAMMAYPCLLAARALTRSAILTPLIAAWLLASWDIFLDPQMTGEGYWTWSTTAPALPGSPGIPLVNYLGWLLVSLVIMALLDRLPRRSGPDGVPNALLAWTYLSSVLASVAFFGRPMVALWGGVAMGIVMVPWAVIVWRSRP